MAQRRTFGSIRKLPSGKWQASYLDPISRERVPGETTFASKADANRWLSAAELALQRGDILDRTGRSITLAEYSATWLDGKTALRPKTRELYEYLLRLHIVPALGQANLTSITPGAIRSWHNDLRSGRIGETTSAKVYRLLRQVLEAAVEDRLIPNNPCRIKGAGTERSKEREIPTIEDVFRAADAIDGHYRAMVLLSAFVGLRRGECFGLTANHLDLEATPPTVRIDQALIPTDAGPYLLQAPKTEAGIRTVAISERLVAELETHLANYASDDLDAFLFPAEPEGDRRGFRASWVSARRESGIDCTFHDLRHLAGTLNAVAGATLKESMKRMGHASPDAALRYQHAIESRDSIIADEINRLMGAAE